MWAKHMGRSPPPPQRKVLVRELAWRHQERIHGGLDAETARLLNAAVRAAQERRAAGSSNTSGPTENVRRRRRQAVKPGETSLPSGARLLRTWPPNTSTTHEVTVVAGGKAFEYRGKSYKSLSEVARVITGTRWSGPRFFGIVSRRGADTSGDAG